MLGTIAPEILHLICQHLNNALDVCNFRLTCKVFAALGLHYLVPRVTLITLPKAFDHLTDISNHGARHSVKKIVLLANKVRNFNNIRSLASSDFYGGYLYDEACSGKPYNQDLGTYKMLQNIWTCYNELRIEQENQESQDDYRFKILQEAFAKLPKLRSIQFGEATAVAEMGRLMPCLRRWPKYRNFPIDITNGIPSESFNTTRHLVCILAAARAAKIILEDLFVASLRPLLFTPGDAIFEGIKQSCQNLRRVHLEFGGEYNPDEYIQAVAKGGIHQVLSSAPQLESIAISFPRFSPLDPIGRPFLTCLFGNTIWPRLAHLDLRSVSASSEGLLTFIESHAKTLKDLQLSYFSLTGQDFHHWHSIFTRFSEILSLKNAQFKGSFLAELSEHENCDYVNMYDEIKGVDMLIGDALAALLCYSPSETEQKIYREIMEDLLRKQRRRRAYEESAEIPVRHSAFLRSLGLDSTCWFERKDHKYKKMMEDGNNMLLEWGY